MNAPTPRAAALASIVATVAARTDPRTFNVALPVVDGKPVGGVLVLFGAPSTKPTPATLRNTFDDAIVDVAPSSDLGNAFLASLPDVVTPVAALGLAVRVAVESDGRWVHNRTAERSSRWTYCAATVTETSVSIVGAGTSAEALADGTLTIDADVPPAVAATLRAEYARARGVVEPTRIAAMVAAHLVKAGGLSVASSAYLLPEITPATCGVLAGLSRLGGWALSFAVVDPAQIAAMTAPVVRSIEEQIDDVVKQTQAFIERAAEVAKPDGPTLQRRTGETVRAGIAAAREAAALWSSRLQLAGLDVEAKLSDLDRAAEDADRAALAAVDARREASKLRKEASRLVGGAA